LLHIKFFGAVRVSNDKVNLPQNLTGRALALFAYLTVSGQPHERSTLANLLWNDISERQAKTNLRYVLRLLRKEVGSYLSVSRQTLAFKQELPYWCDEKTFSRNIRTLLQSNNINTIHLQQTVDLYQADFLEGFSIRNAPLFDDWISVQRQAVRTQMIQGLHKLVSLYIQEKNYHEGLSATHRLLELEPWNETAHRQQMQLFSYTNQRAAALKQYTICKQIVWDEYGAELEPETTELYDQLQSGTLPSPLPPSLPSLQSSFLQANSDDVIEIQRLKNRKDDPPVAAMQVNWDAIPMPPRLYGRESELDLLIQWLTASDNKIISLTGLGGQGKSMLAASAVAELAEEGNLSEGSDTGFQTILWCSLKNIATLEQLIQFWFTRLSTRVSTYNNRPLDTLSATEHPYTEKLFTDLISVLQEKRSLLILDQTEHIYPAPETANAYQPSYEQFGELLERISQSEHQSCLLLIGRAKCRGISRLEKYSSRVRHFTLPALPIDAGVQILRKQGIQDDEQRLEELVIDYDCNPLALTLLAEMIKTYPEFSPIIPIAPTEVLSTINDNGIYPIQEQKRAILLLDDLKKILSEQISTLPLEKRKVLNWLAVQRGDAEIHKLWEKLSHFNNSATYLEAQRSLQDYNLVMWDQIEGRLQLPNLILTYLTEHFVETVSQEIVDIVESVQTVLIFKDTALPDTEKDEVYSQAAINTFMQSWAQKSRGPSYLDHYHLVDQTALPALQSKQQAYLLQPVAQHLIDLWGMSNTWYHLKHLLDFQAQIGLVSDHMQTNFRHLLAYIESTS